MDDLMTDYDVIVVGTGMTESILASALSRIGKSVLHMDSLEYYGENWASFNFDGMQNWIQRMNTDVVDSGEGNKGPGVELNESEIYHGIKSAVNVSHVEEKWHCKREEGDSLEKPGGEVSALSVDDGECGDVCSNDSADKERDIEKTKEPKIDSTQDAIRRESRRFNLDLCPKVLFSRGPLVELLISSNIAKYAEFKSVSRVLTWRNESLELVPCSRADVFSTKNITVVEKRLLVKILTLFLNYPENSEELSGFENRTFLDYLKHRKLPSNIIHYILYAMAMGDKDTSCLDGVKASKSFMESLGRYGNTPFIFPMYGAGELPQCFCRLCAVFGGVYYLKRTVDGLVMKDGKCVAALSEGKRLNAKIFVLSSNYVPEGLNIEKETNVISRGIFITDRSILKSEKEPLTLLLYPPVPNVSDKSVTVIEVGPGTNTCPDGFYIVHMTASTTLDASSDLRHVADALFRSDVDDDATSHKPRVLWSVTWNVTQTVITGHQPENVKMCSGPNADLDYNFSIDEARRLFTELCPGEEFLPRAPDPDEIVMPYEEENSGEGDKVEAASKNDMENGAGATVDGDDRGKD